MSGSAPASAGGAAGVSSGPASLRAAFDVFNEVVRTEGDVLAFVQGYFHPRAEFRPIEDRDWFRDPEAIARSLSRWIETWAPGSYRIEPEQILELGDDRFVVQFRTKGVGRGSGVPIEAVTCIACIWREGKFAWFDEYSDREGALAALGEPAPVTGEAAPDHSMALGERLVTLGESAFAALVRRRTDRQLERLFDSGPALRTIFKRMEQVFEPAKAGDFSGEIQYELLGRAEVKKWVVRVDSDRVTVRAGEAAAPNVRVSMGLALFIRIAARQVHPAKAFREGGLEIGGNFEAAARIGAMFGLSR
jgi:ketosteroid isomerase-like protein